MPQGTGRLAGKVAIVTGAGASDGAGIGVGRAIAITFARSGASVLVVDRERDHAEITLRDLKDSDGIGAVSVADVTDASQCDAMVRAALDQWGQVDILVNNVGIPTVGTVVDTSEEDWDRSIAINLKSAFLSAKYAIPAMIESGGGSIINISSMSGIRATGTVAYSAAKAGMIGLTIETAYSFGRQGIRVNAIAPGHISTPIISRAVAAQGREASVDGELRAQAAPLGTEGTAWDVASAALYLASDESRWVTGVVLPVDAGVITVTPLAMLRYLR
jgi:NAD(P)-dependent dehydrogenase (short-subunit alcohol dehydrogenase family)